MYRLSVRPMITETFFLTEDSHRISTLSLREKLSLHDHELGRCPKNREIAVIARTVWGTTFPSPQGMKPPAGRHLRFFA
jgi:hypothetical protein